MRRKKDFTKTTEHQPPAARRIHDEPPDQAAEKPTGIASCPVCAASYRDGRWTWKPAAVGTREKVCPACERIADEYPAGVLHVEGVFAAAHRSDLIALIRNIEERECAEHPLKRVMDIADEESGFVVTTTDAKLVQTLGRALEKAYAGKLTHPPTTSDKENLVRVHWVRD